MNMKSVLVFLALLTALLPACLNQWDPANPNIPEAGNPCGSNWIPCFEKDAKTGDLVYQHTCCRTYEVCGGDFPNVGCAKNLCCDEGSQGLFSAKLPHAQRSDAVKAD
jgi:hypothetical protein